MQTNTLSIDWSFLLLRGKQGLLQITSVDLSSFLVYLYITLVSVKYQLCAQLWRKVHLSAHTCPTTVRRGTRLASGRDVDWVTCLHKGKNRQCSQSRLNCSQNIPENMNQKQNWTCRRIQCAPLSTGRIKLHHTIQKTPGEQSGLTHQNVSQWDKAWLIGNQCVSSTRREFWLCYC